MKIIWISGAALLLANAAAHSQQNSPTIDDATVEKTVKECLDQIHKIPSDNGFINFYAQFDAYYNRATKEVNNNAYRVGDNPVLFKFNKCMAERGLPLGPK